MPPILVFLIGIAVLMVLCVVFKVNAFISLLVTALVFGALTGMGGVEIVDTITAGFAGTVESIGIVIIFGIMLGNYLDASKATNRMALDTVRLVGQKRSGIAMSICGYIISIPVFSDAAMVILTPLVKSIHKKTRIPLAILAVSLASGLLATHVYVPPTPGPLAAAGLLGIDIGEAILYGAFAAVFMTLFGTVFAHLFFKNKPDSYYSWRDDAEQKEEKEISDGKDLMDDKDLPGTLASILLSSATRPVRCSCRRIPSWSPSRLSSVMRTWLWRSAHCLQSSSLERGWARISRQPADLSARSSACPEQVQTWHPW